MADVDLCRMEPLQQRFPKVRVYQDWREMLKKERKNIDSVNVSVPDHMHFPVAMEAMKPASTSTCRSRCATRCAKRGC